MKSAGMIIEPHEIIRSGLEELLIKTDKISQVASYSTWGAAHEELRYDPPHVVIASSRLGLVAMEALVSCAAETSTWVLILVSTADSSQVADAVRVQAKGFLSESDLTVDSIVLAMEQVAQGCTPMPSLLAQKLMKHAARGQSPRPVGLTCREQGVLEYMAEGLSNKEIARELAISHHGVKRHVANVLAKLHCPNRTLAVMTAIRQGILAPPCE